MLENQNSLDVKRDVYHRNVHMCVSVYVCLCVFVFPSSEIKIVCNFFVRLLHEFFFLFIFSLNLSLSLSLPQSAYLSLLFLSLSYSILLFYLVEKIDQDRGQEATVFAIQTHKKEQTQD